jgi:hypothetical protein
MGDIENFPDHLKNELLNCELHAKKKKIKKRLMEYHAFDSLSPLCLPWVPLLHWEKITNINKKHITNIANKQLHT